mmetsp:Transcript_42670/g.112469  ORF Transcript_42670/g.112469 Transcript_42670/m.112469 type:complete len:88 (+) Transcript_42670:49-312(+)
MLVRIACVCLDMVGLCLLSLSLFASVAESDGVGSLARRCEECRFIAENIGVTVTKSVQTLWSPEKKRSRTRKSLESRKILSLERTWV